MEFLPPCLLREIWIAGTSARMVCWQDLPQRRDEGHEELASLCGTLTMSPTSSVHCCPPLQKTMPEGALSTSCVLPPILPKATALAQAIEYSSGPPPDDEIEAWKPTPHAASRRTGLRRSALAHGPWKAPDDQVPQCMRTNRPTSAHPICTFSQRGGTTLGPKTSRPEQVRPR